MEAYHILVVHSEPAVRHLAAEALGQKWIRVSLASSDEEGLSLLERERVHVLVTGLDVFGIGDGFVRRAATVQPLLGVVLIADAVRIAHIPQHAQPGPVQYLPKPVSQESLRSAVQRALDRQARPGPAQSVTEKAVDASSGGSAGAIGEPRPIVAASKATREIMEVVRQSAPTDVAVLIQGEPDTGKEMIAREIHRQSHRAAGPFVRVACGALREPELAEKLFGRRERGSDCGGQTPSTLLETAHGGTLFLDNVSKLPLWAQVTLLDILQQRRPLASGNDQAVAVDVRIIASTETDLHSATARHAFLPGLYYYLNVVQISVPPLRHRLQDIRPLAEMYLAIANSMRSNQPAKPPCRFSEDAFQCLLEYDWPGNILQLGSVVAHTVLLADNEQISRAKVSEAIGRVAPRGDSETISVPLVGGLKEMERAIIEAVIDRCRGNKAAAARVLRLHRRTLYRMLQDEAATKKDTVPMPFLDSPTVGTPETTAYC